MGVVQMERYRTRSDMETMSIYKLTIAQILNTVIIPVLVHNDPSDWCPPPVPLPPPLPGNITCACYPGVCD